MSVFRLEISLEGDALTDEHTGRLELARLLAHAANRVVTGDHAGGALVDVNGNGVGSFWTEED